MTDRERLIAIEETLRDTANDWDAESLSFVLTQYISPEIIEGFAKERVETFATTALEHGIDTATTMIMCWLDGFCFGAKFVEED